MVLRKKLKMLFFLMLPLLKVSLEKYGVLTGVKQLAVEVGLFVMEG